MLLFNLLFYYLVSNVVIHFICIWNFFYDGKINTYGHKNLSPSFRHKKYLAHIGAPGNAENNCTKLPGFGFTKLGSYIREMMRNITCQWKVFNVENPWAVFYGFFQYFLFYCKMIFFISLFFFKLGSLHARLNSHYKAWSYKKKKHKKITSYRKSV